MTSSKKKSSDRQESDQQAAEQQDAKVSDQSHDQQATSAPSIGSTKVRSHSLSRRKSLLAIGTAAVGLSVLFLPALRRWYRPSPTQMLCPIAAASVSDPSCELFTGQRYRQNLYRLVPAVELTKNELGLYRTFDDELVSFRSVGFNPYPVEYSVVYPQDVLLYKTERASNDPAKCPVHLTNYGLCDTPIDRVVFGGGVTGEVDLAISFQIAATLDNLEQLYDIGGPQRLIELFKQVVRGNRQLTSIDAQIANTEAGSAQIEQSFRQVLNDWSLSHLIELETISVRSVVVGGVNYRQQQEAQATRVSQQNLEAQSLEFSRTQQLKDAEGFAQAVESICQSVPPEQCPQMMWVLMYGAQVQPFLNENGQLSAPVPVSPLPAQPGSPAPSGQQARQ